MEENFKSFFVETKNSLFEYLRLRIRLLKLETTARLSKMIGSICVMIVAVLFFLFSFLFLGFAFASWMVQLTGNLPLGFVITAGAFIFIALMLIILKRWLIIRPIMRIVVSKFSDTLNEDEDEDY